MWLENQLFSWIMERIATIGPLFLRVPFPDFLCSMLLPDNFPLHYLPALSNHIRTKNLFSFKTFLYDNWCASVWSVWRRGASIFCYCYDKLPQTLDLFNDCHLLFHWFMDQKWWWWAWLGPLPRTLQIWNPDTSQAVFSSGIWEVESTWTHLQSSVLWGYGTEVIVFSLVPAMTLALLLEATQSLSPGPLQLQTSSGIAVLVLAISDCPICCSRRKFF